MNTSLTDKLHERMMKYSGDAFDICSDIYKYITDAPEEDRVSLFSLACKEYGIVDSDGTLKVPNSIINHEKQDELKSTYGRVIDALLDSAIKTAVDKRYDDETFYKFIWEKIVCNSLFRTEEERLFAFYYIIIDKKIPYYSISSGLEMDNKRYQSIIEANESNIQKLKFILAVRFDQRTQEASNLLDVLLSQDSYDVQVVLLSKIVSELRSNRNDFISDLLRKISEE